MDKSKVLHICGDYPNQKLYKQMFDYNNSLGLKQICYVPVRKKKLIGKNKIDALFLKYSHIIKKWHKFMFFSKIKLLRNDILSNISLNDVKLIHAHTLFSDGAVAYELYKQYNIPYILASSKCPIPGRIIFVAFSIIALLLVITGSDAPICINIFLTDPTFTIPVSIIAIIIC